MRFADIEATSARDFLRGVLDRNRPRDDVEAWKVQLHLGVEGGRVIWAVGRYLEVHKIRGVGVEDTDFSIDHIMKFLAGLVEDMKNQDGDEKIVIMGPRELRILTDAERHLDHYCLINSPGFSKNKSGGGKKK